MPSAGFIFDASYAQKGHKNPASKTVLGRRENANFASKRKKSVKTRGFHDETGVFKEVFLWGSTENIPRSLAMRGNGMLRWIPDQRSPAAPLSRMTHEKSPEGFFISLNPAASLRRRAC
jgi:hypothetical protein